MSSLSQIKAIEKEVKNRSLDSRVHFFDTPEAYENAVTSGLIGDSDVCIVDDILNDETTAITRKIDSSV